MVKPHTQCCSLAGALNLFGDSWTLMVVREAFFGTTRFGDFQNNIKIAKNILADRLNLLIEKGILKKVDVGERGVRYEYSLTEKGESLITVLVAMYQWGDRWLLGEGNEPLLLKDRETLSPIAELVVTNRDGQKLSRADLLAEPGPGADAETRAWLANTQRRRRVR